MLTPLPPGLMPIPKPVLLGSFDGFGGVYTRCQKLLNGSRGVTVIAVVSLVAAKTCITFSPARGDLLERQPLQSVFPLRSFRCQPDEVEFIDCRPHVETLRNKEHASAVF